MEGWELEKYEEITEDIVEAKGIQTVWWRGFVVMLGSVSLNDSSQSFKEYQKKDNHIREYISYKKVGGSIRNIVNLFSRYNCYKIHVKPWDVEEGCYTVISDTGH